MLVVVAIIAVLAGGLAIGLGGGRGSALKSSANLLSSQFQAVRTSAILNNAPARLLIDKSADKQNGARRLQIVRQTTNSSGGVIWERSGPVMRLPEGTFVVLEGDIPRSTKASGETGPDEMVQDGAPWAYYEFSSTGACEKNAGARIVVASGFNNGTGWVRPNTELIQGLFLTRLGEAVFFEDPEQIRSSFSQSQ